ncbi:PorT family protein [Sabulilitoribacter multivorans]|uniref:PorT family protein n=1 Tax=Flaviramulus multivorans TaxID=1304750 RepID=A0ABS9IFS0_9FLAO|nr:porin family protein [Flaviramulus multivorans]MCF7559015.1 PorT family protein [Flaviramulus multivorans]
MKANYFRINIAISLLTLIGGLQTISAQKTGFGIKGGYNLSNLSTDLSGMKDISGFHIGGLLEYRVSNKFSIQPELLYSLEGGKYSISYSESNEDGEFVLKAKEEITLGFINLPVTAKYYLKDRFSVETGIQFGYVVSAKSEYDFFMEADGDITSTSGERNIKGDVKSLNTSLNFGLGYELKNKMLFQARYNLGLTNLDKSFDSMDDEDFIGKVKSKGVLISIGYKF